VSGLPVDTIAEEKRAAKLEGVQALLIIKTQAECRTVQQLELHFVAES
jgi:hypothetical protein